jgi:phage baseplate assembly protein W
LLTRAVANSNWDDSIKEFIRIIMATGSVERAMLPDFGYGLERRFHPSLNFYPFPLKADFG